MRYKLLGRSGLRVSELCLRTITFGEAWREMRIAASQQESRQIFEAFVEAGGNFIDTANNYNAGSSEKFVGEFIASERERFVLATKYSLSMRPGDPNGGGNQRKAMVQSLEASLRRLNTDYIDLYWLHAWDLQQPGVMIPLIGARTVAQFQDRQFGLRRLYPDRGPIGTVE